MQAASFCPVLKLNFLIKEKTVGLEGSRITLDSKLWENGLKTADIFSSLCLRGSAIFSTMRRFYSLGCSFYFNEIRSTGGQGGMFGYR